MALTATNALVAIAVGTGAPVNQAAGQVLFSAAGASLTWSLQSTTRIQAWSVTIQCDDAILNGVVLQWSAGQINQLFLTTPLAPFALTYTSVVSDGSSSVAQVIGQVQATNSVAGTLSGNVNGPANSNLVYGANTPASVPRVEYTQSQATTSAIPAVMCLRSQGAKAGSGTQGSIISFITGYSDGGTTGRQIWFGSEAAVGASEPGPNYWGMAILEETAGAANVFSLGVGNNGAGGGVAGGEIAATTLLSLATEGTNAQVQMGPIANAKRAIVNTFSDGVIGVPFMQFLDSDLVTSALSGFIALPWASSATSQPILVQRNSGNTVDLQIVARVVNELYFGSLTENNRYHCQQRTLFEVSSAGDVGFRFQGPSGTIFTAASDGFKSISQGCDVGKDGKIWGLYGANTAIASQVTIVTIATVTNATQAIEVEIQARDGSTGEFISQVLYTSLVNASGTLTLATDAGANGAVTLVNRGHSATPTYAGVAAALSISGSNILLKVTPWTTNSVHWSVRVGIHQDTGTF